MIEKLKNLFKKKEEKAEPTVEEHIADMFTELKVDAVKICIGGDLSEYGENLGCQLGEFRDNLFEKTGFIFPPVRVIVSDEIQENEFRILLREKLTLTGYCRLNQEDAVSEIINSLQNVYENNIDRIFSNEIAEKYIDTVQKQNGWLIWNLTNAMPAWGIRLVLVRLLQQGRSIKDINYIFDKICKYATKNRDVCIKADPYLVSEKMCSEYK